MARINIEEDAWKRVYRLADYYGCSVREALGTVGCLWGDSQDLVKTHGTKEEIVLWANLTKLSDEEREKWISCLETARFISLEKNGTYKIHGNEIQIESRAKHASKSSKGGKALKKKLAELRKLKASPKSATGTPVVSHRGLNALQGITLQGNAIQCSSKQSNTIQILDSENSENSKSAIAQKTKGFIAGYCSRFNSRYGTNPEIQGKDAGIAKRIVKNLSEEKIQAYLDAFFAMPDTWLVKFKHPIAAFETKLNEIVVFANDGTFTTMKQATQADNSVTNMQLLQEVRRGVR